MMAKKILKTNTRYVHTAVEINYYKNITYQK